jgi:hypothetical protein
MIRRAPTGADWIWYGRELERHARNESRAWSELARLEARLAELADSLRARARELEGDELELARGLRLASAELEAELEARREAELERAIERARARADVVLAELEAARGRQLLLELEAAE